MCRILENGMFITESTLKYYNGGLTVCLVTPQSHSGEGILPHLCRNSAHYPCPVRILLRLDHTLRVRWKPGG